MKLQVTGLHMEVGDALKAHCEENIKSMKSFFPEMIDVNVQFHKDKIADKADIIVHASHIRLRAMGSGDDFYRAVDSAFEKLLRQLERYKGRLQKHRRRREKESYATIKPMMATRHNLEEKSLEETPEVLNDGYVPEIVHKNVESLSVMSVDEAVMQMDLMHENVLLFQNIQTGGMNIVQRQANGTVSWIEADKVTA